MGFATGRVVRTRAHPIGGPHMAQLQLRELTPAFGTEITGLDPIATLADADACRTLQDLFDTRGVLVFRDLDVDQVTQANLVRMLIRLGPLGAGETGSAKP